MIRPGRITLPALVLMLLACAGAASGQALSPGPLSRPHADLEGVRNCTQCHELGQRAIDAGRCLSCHTALRDRVRDGHGFHGAPAVAGKPCEECHREHAGRDVPLVSWGGPRESFDHGRAGWALEGAHRKQACDACHNPRAIRAADVREALSRNPEMKTFLGLGTTCVSCHFDEHRGQLSADCATCHTQEAWKPAPRFDHARAAFALDGAHRKVGCAKCHASLSEPEAADDVFPKPRAAAYLRLKPVAHAECSDCHKDPHAGRLGGRCGSCHTADSWARTTTAGTSSGFRHEKTRFPLEDRHRDVACAGCHPAGPGGEMRLTGFPFARCADCHEDAHAGQIPATAAADCGACHTTAGFKPARFTLEDHARTRYPLTGGHEAVPCAGCHPADPSLAKDAWRKPPRVFRADLTRFAYGERDLRDCATCHADPHGGQFRTIDAVHRPRACAECHRIGSFRDLAFDHGRDTPFPLRGKHARARCGSCHASSEMPGPARESLAPWMKPPVPLQATVYRSTPADCGACHTDAHLGQFAAAGRTDCAACHTEDTFTPATRFDHGRARFPLTGAHAKAKCPSCHRVVSVLPERTTALYKPLGIACGQCHEDPHGGAFTPAGVSCESCHAATAWSAVRFDHDRTGFRLGTAHSGVACASCHLANRTSPPPRDCAGCHEDPHGGALTSACGNCHLDAASFREPGAAAFHERTRLPLLGRHAAIPCASCHADRSSEAFTAPDPSCASCHMADFARTAAAGLDHRAWGFPSACENCHDTFRWDLASFPEHERCFPIRTGAHANIPCLDCHTGLPAGPTTGCATMTAACTRCHPCNEVSGAHGGVAGFECRDRKCYECHPGGGAE